MRSLANGHSMVQVRALTANICLGEDRVDRKCEVIVMWALFSHVVLSGPYSGNPSRGGMSHGNFPTSSPRTDSPDLGARQSFWSGFPIWPSLRVLELFSRRCRWFNGSSFVAMHRTVKFHYTRRSSHTLSRKFLLHIDLLYWFASCVSH